MKKIFLLFFLFLFSVYLLRAQKGTWRILGNTGFYFSKDSANTKRGSWYFSPAVGYQFSKHLIIGLRGGYSQVYQNKRSSPKLTFNGYYAGPWLRYVHRIMGIFSWYAQLNVSYLGGYVTLGSEPSFARWTGWGFDVVPAIRTEISHGLAFGFGIGGLSYAATKYDGAAQGSSGLVCTFGRKVFIGMAKKINRKHRKEPA